MRVFAPDEEIPFHFIASEVNALIVAVETTLGLPLRVTGPLRAKIMAQLEEQPLPDGLNGQENLGLEAAAAIAQQEAAAEIGSPRSSRSRAS